MKLYFDCELLSDIVLTSRSASEGFHGSLDYIPGAKFLGIVAGALYDNNDPKRTLNLFHNGAVKFGDAHLIIDEGYSYHVPFDWFSDKTKVDKTIYLNHKLSKETKEKQAANALQLKQQRQGYLKGDGNKIATVDQLFSIKSAYDRGNRKSQDEEMYGYHAIKSGTKFCFSVEVPDKIYADLIIKHLSGKKRVGRSRTAEYGLVEIKNRTGNPYSELDSKSSKGNTAMVYAASNLCFYNAYGFPTTDIQARDLGISDGVIQWQSSQVRTKKYQSFNSKRKQVNEDRIVFEKGSVFVIQTNEPQRAEGFSNWVGALNNEGLGRIILNPNFLISESETRLPPEPIEDETPNNILSYKKKAAADDKILALIKRRSDFVNTDLLLEELVNAFFEEQKKEFAKGISKSQWGAIRGIAKSAPDAQQCRHLLFHKDEAKPKDSEGFLRRGIAENLWRGDKVDALESFSESHANSQTLLIKFASKMQKYLAENEK